MPSITLKKSSSDLGKTTNLTTKSLKVAKDAAFKALPGPSATCSVNHNGKLVGTWVHTKKGWDWSHD